MEKKKLQDNARPPHNEWPACCTLSLIYPPAALELLYIHTDRQSNILASLYTMHDVAHNVVCLEYLAAISALIVTALDFCPFVTKFNKKCVKS